MDNFIEDIRILQKLVICLSNYNVKYTKNEFSVLFNELDPIYCTYIRDIEELSAIYNNENIKKVDSIKIKTFEDVLYLTQYIIYIISEGINHKIIIRYKKCKYVNYIDIKLIYKLLNYLEMKYNVRNTYSKTKNKIFKVDAVNRLCELRNKYGGDSMLNIDYPMKIVKDNEIVMKVNSPLIINPINIFNVE